MNKISQLCVVLPFLQQTPTTLSTLYAMSRQFAYSLAHRPTTYDMSSTNWSQLRTKCFLPNFPLTPEVWVSDTKAKSFSHGMREPAKVFRLTFPKRKACFLYRYILLLLHTKGAMICVWAVKMKLNFSVLWKRSCLQSQEVKYFTKKLPGNLNPLFSHRSRDGKCE